MSRPGGGGRAVLVRGRVAEAVTRTRELADGGGVSVTGGQIAGQALTSACSTNCTSASPRS